MKKIEIDLIDENNLLEKYNTKKVSKDLINYLIESAIYLKKDDKIKIVINNYLNNENPIKLIKDGLKNEYDKSIKKHFITDRRQIIYFILGLIAIFISTLLEIEVLREIILIGGWVLIWDMVELEMFSDREGRKKREILKKLLASDFIENKLPNKKST